VLVDPTPVYNATGAVGSFSFNTTATGVEWQGSQPGFGLAAGPPGAYSSNLRPGQTVLVLGLAH